MFNYQTNIFNQKTILPLKVFNHSLMRMHHLWLTYATRYQTITVNTVIHYSLILNPLICESPPAAVGQVWQISSRFIVFSSHVPTTIFNSLSFEFKNNYFTFAPVSKRG
jgi:hypothetical protein